MTDLTIPVNERASFFPDSPELSQADAITKYDAWFAGHTVTSSVVRVGRIGTLPAEDSLIKHDLRGLPYDSIDSYPKLADAVSGLVDSVEAVAKADIDRCRLEGGMETIIMLGDFATANSEPWHTDNDWPAIRWNASFGIGGTIGTEGQVRLSDVNEIGDFLGRVSSGPEGQLRPTIYEAGDVLRFMTAGDIHSGPVDTGPRILVISTFFLTRHGITLPGKA